MPAPAPSRHRERLYVPLSWWLLSLGFGFTLVVAVGAYTNVWFGAATAVLVLAVIGMFFWAYGHVLVVAEERGLRAGRALLEWRYVGELEVLDREAARRALGPGSLASGWMLTRPYTHGAVRATVVDPADPHPFWLVSCRHPERVAEVARAHLAEGSVR